MWVTRNGVTLGIVSRCLCSERSARGDETVIESILVRIETMDEGVGFFISSKDLPELNVLVREERNLTSAIPNAVKYIDKRNRGLDVRVLREVPVFRDTREVAVLPQEIERQDA